MTEKHIYICWLMTDLLLGMGLLVWPPALWAAIVFTTLHSVCFVASRPDASSFTLQVRFVYLALLIIGQLPYCRWINWIQLFGTTALLTVDYCPLARVLSLAPWNRSQPLNAGLVARALFTPPVRGSILQTLQPPLRSPGT